MILIGKRSNMGSKHKRLKERREPILEAVALIFNTLWGEVDTFPLAANQLKEPTHQNSQIGLSIRSMATVAMEMQPEKMSIREEGMHRC